MSYRDERMALRERIQALEKAQAAAAPDLAEAEAKLSATDEKVLVLERWRRTLRARKGRREFAAGVVAVLLVVVCGAASVWASYLSERTEQLGRASSWTDGRSGEVHRSPCFAEINDPLIGPTRALVECVDVGVIYDDIIHVRSVEHEYWNHGASSVVWSERFGRIIVRRDDAIYVLGTR